MGWIAHFMIGPIIWGGLFALFGPNLPGGSLWLKGVIFGARPLPIMPLSIGWVKLHVSSLRK